jgi:hypothetical protein
MGLIHSYSNTHTLTDVSGIGNPTSSLETPAYKMEVTSEEAACRMKNYTGTCSDPRHLPMELESFYSEGSTEKSDLQDILAFPSTESGRYEPVVWHVEKLLDTHVSSEPDTYQRPSEDLSRHEEKESCMSVPMQIKESGGIFYFCTTNFSFKMMYYFWCSRLLTS